MPEAAADATEHPLIFTLRDAISGRGYLAGVTIRGKGIMVQEYGSWWLYGVRPGAIAACGRNPQEAFLQFREQYKQTLFEFADEAPTFEAFRQLVEDFYYQAEPDEEERWEKALAVVRAGKAIPEPFSGLPRQTPEGTPFQITVESLSAGQPRFMPSDNVGDTTALAA